MKFEEVNDLRVLNFNFEREMHLMLYEGIVLHRFLKASFHCSQTNPADYTYLSLWNLLFLFCSLPIKLIAINFPRILLLHLNSFQFVGTFSCCRFHFWVFFSWCLSGLPQCNQRTILQVHFSQNYHLLWLIRISWICFSLFLFVFSVL